MTMQYTIVEEIGSGGSATVYRAVTPDGRVLAVKRLHAGSADHDHTFREANTLAELSHDNVVSFYGVGYTKHGELDLLMEWVDGCDLTTLQGPRRIPLAAALFIASEVLHGLDAIHTRGWLHRDVTPNNILVSKTGEVKLADLGQARFIGSKRTTAMMRGTPLYMAPERHRTLGELDASSDLFAVGVVLYELIARAMPFDSVERIVARNRPLTPLTAHNPALPDDINRLVLKMLQWRPEDRYRSASQALGDLSRVLDPKAKQLGHVELVDHMGEWCALQTPGQSVPLPAKRRPRYLVAFAGFAALAVLGAVASSMVDDYRDARQATPPAASTPDDGDGCEPSTGEPGDSPPTRHVFDDSDATTTETKKKASAPAAKQRRLKHTTASAALRNAAAEREQSLGATHYMEQPRQSESFGATLYLPTSDKKPEPPAENRRRSQ